MYGDIKNDKVINSMDYSLLSRYILEVENPYLIRKLQI